MCKNTTEDKLNEIIGYIEENIRNKITLEELSDYFNISKYHLHRLFKAMTKRRLMNYVKSRKLAHSVDTLINTKLRIIDIAQEFNFNYEQSYIRAFTKTYGLSPDEFRKKRCKLEITDKITISNIMSENENDILVKLKTSLNN